MINVLVTGGNGQLAACLKDLVFDLEGYTFTFLGKSELDISNSDQVDQNFSDFKWDFCINCAAYTAVDKAESEIDLATRINKIGVKNLAESCKKYKTKLIHISTDFVFNGDNNQPYKEVDSVAPLGVYGLTKLEGEQEVTKVLEQYFVIRTSWLYSEHGNNFMKTMLRLGAERSSLGVVSDQHGTPTYAKDLARFVLTLVKNDSSAYGVYHYSNLGETTWYGFAKEIFKLSNLGIDLKGIVTSEYPTPAERPKYSVLDKTKTMTTFHVQIPTWQAGLKEALSNL